ncbi:hypothetical protein EAI_00765 [Harpegnathos saltator]|uniref:Uncharacterized protein n=1 Tax=Harpegnathos saltator TaxID=610380 RepID=E2B2N6_HARSA|nr:hypothetical protein EAI_00765 [Harpegnathos saltator]
MISHNLTVNGCDEQLASEYCQQNANNQRVSAHETEINSQKHTACLIKTLGMTQKQMTKRKSPGISHRVSFDNTHARHPLLEILAQHSPPPFHIYALMQMLARFALCMAYDNVQSALRGSRLQTP